MHEQPPADLVGVEVDDDRARRPGPTSSTSISAMHVSPGLRMLDTHQPRWGGWLSLRVTSTRPGGPSIEGALDLADDAGLPPPVDQLDLGVDACPPSCR